MGLLGIILYITISGSITALAIPFQFIDMSVGMIYSVKEATLILISAKMLGASLSFYIANFFLNSKSKESFMSNKYLKGLQELVRKEPLKYGVLVRFATIPLIVRNYGLALLPINYSKFILCVFF
mmetsp:Transcript_4002/g.3915  ORF Transcript_4002/g.3915 Transcript_4002/m.3915 type:complete len:125 (+) Transcript_4002:91-465(+)